MENGNQTANHLRHSPAASQAGTIQSILPPTMQSFSFPRRTEQAMSTKLKSHVETDNSQTPDDALLNRTQANFIEYVLERMLFGVMQELVAGDDDM